MNPRRLLLLAAMAAMPAIARAEAVSESVDQLVSRGRAQYLAGENAAAAETFHRVQVADPQNQAAGYFLARLGREAGSAERVRATRHMITEVEQAWRRPEPFAGEPDRDSMPPPSSPLQAKLDAIVLPAVNFNGMDLGRVVNTLSVVSAELDRSSDSAKGVNVVLVDPDGGNPTVTITLRNLTLRRVLDFITHSVGYEYEVQTDAVVVRPVGQAAVETRFFPVSRPTVLRMIGRGAESTAPTNGAARAEPAAVPTPAVEAPAIRSFFQLAGIDFDTVAGSALAFDGSQLIATQTPRNLDRMANILNRYRDARQVEIEAKFLEVQQGALDEIGVQWNLATKASQSGSTRIGATTGSGVNRSLADAFRNATSSQLISISGAGQPPDGLNIPTPAPAIPGGVLLGTAAGPLATLTGVVGEFDVQAMLRALSQKSGTELLSAPRLTVLSGNPATITVAQELRYPQSYGQIQSQVGTGSVSGGGSAGVSITSGTPQDFTTRNVGVELRVTPTVEEDNQSVSLELNPKVTEFEGFVEYGGPSVAISGGTTVTVPPGFYQPIFAVREVTTRVTVWDGATLVMGGLTREDVKKVSDKVPVLGNLPGVGRLFRSKGESSQKRNLLIFVTANLVTPGGGLKRQAGAPTTASTRFENPQIVTATEGRREGGGRARPTRAK
jgi:general secretion pathway protein D